MKRIMLSILALALCVSLIIPIYSANESNDLGISFSASLDHDTLTVSEVDQTVVLTVVASGEVETASISYTAVAESPLVLANLAGDGLNVTGATTNLATGVFSWSSTDGGVRNVTTIAKVTVTVPAKTPAGTYDIGIEGIQLSKDYGMTVIEDGASATATLTIKEAPTADYTTSLSADKESINVDETVMVSVTVDGKVGEFASSQLVFTYDTNYLTFDAEGSDLSGASASDNNGTITLVDHGETQSNGVAYQLAFEGKAVTDTDSVITLTSAAFDKEANAPTHNIPIFTPDAATNTVSVSVVEKRYEVTLHEYFQTEDGVLFVEEGGAFTFSAKDPNYNYTVTVNGGTYSASFDGATGEWTVSNVQDDLTITATRTPKTFDVTIDTPANFNPVPTTGENAATYKQDYTFTLKADDTDYVYSLVSIKIDGVDAPAGSYTNTDKVYTILGDYITGDIEITTKAQEKETYTITITGVGGVLSSSAESVKSGTEVTLTLTPREGYKYTFTLNGTPITMDGNNQYTEEVTENWVVNVTEELDLDEQDVKIGVGENSTYLSLEGKTVYLIQITADVAEGYAYTYDDEIMFWSDEYNNGSYVILVIQDANAAAPTFETVKTHIKVEQLEQEEKVKTILYTGDVNMAGEDKVDANDAQLVWNIYNGQRYTSFNELPMEKFLRADVDADGDVDVDDAAEIVTIIQGN